MAGPLDVQPPGRPVGSTTGRSPADGYPSLGPKLGGFLAGFIEGEGSFTIDRQSRGDNHRCVMSAVARDDDAPLIRELASSTALGTVTTRRRSRSRPQVAWTVTAKSDCKRLVELLDVYPLRGRKARDYAIWAAAMRWWIDTDPTRLYRNRDWAPMIYLRGRLRDAKRFARSRSYTVDDAGTGLAGDWGPYLAGFFTAEGTLGIHRNGPGRYVPRAQITLRCDDRPLLEEIRARLGVGRIYTAIRPREPQGPSVCWMVRGAPELVELVAAFDRCPLRGRHRHQYAIWRQAVLEYTKPGPRRPIHDRLGELRSELAEVTAYSPDGST